VCCCVDYHGPRTRARSMTIDRSLFLFSILGRAYCCVDRFVGLGFGGLENLKYSYKWSTESSVRLEIFGTELWVPPD
jgi:hypothetical protein